MAECVIDFRAVLGTGDIAPEAARRGNREIWESKVDWGRLSGDAYQVLHVKEQAVKLTV